MNRLILFLSCIVTHPTFSMADTKYNDIELQSFINAKKLPIPHLDDGARTAVGILLKDQAGDYHMMICDDGLLRMERFENIVDRCELFSPELMRRVVEDSWRPDTQKPVVWYNVPSTVYNIGLLHTGGSRDLFAALSDRLAKRRIDVPAAQILASFFQRGQILWS